MSHIDNVIVQLKEMITANEKMIAENNRILNACRSPCETRPETRVVLVD